MSDDAWNGWPHCLRLVYVVASTLVKCSMNVRPSLKFPIPNESLEIPKKTRKTEEKSLSKDAVTELHIESTAHTTRNPLPQIPFFSTKGKMREQNKKKTSQHRLPNPTSIVI